MLSHSSLNLREIPGGLTMTRVPERSTIFWLFLFNANNRTTKGTVNNNSVNVKAGEQQ